MSGRYNVRTITKQIQANQALAERGDSIKDYCMSAKAFKKLTGFTAETALRRRWIKLDHTEDVTIKCKVKTWVDDHGNPIHIHPSRMRDGYAQECLSNIFGEKKEVVSTLTVAKRFFTFTDFVVENDGLPITTGAMNYLKFWTRQKEAEIKHEQARLDNIRDIAFAVL